MKRKYPFSFLLSGFMQGLLLNVVAGAVGLCFLVFGFLASFSVLTIIGALVLVFFLVMSVVLPVRLFREASKQITVAEWEEILDAVFDSEEKNVLSSYRRVLTAIEKKAEKNAGNTAGRNAEAAPIEGPERENEIAPGPRYALPTFREFELRGRSGVAKIAGALFLLAAVYFIAQAVSAYAQQWRQSDWPVTVATVVSINGREEYDSQKGRNGGYRTVYDICYQYSVNGAFYTGQIIGSRSSSAVGEGFSIKYDPQSPAVSTDITEPRTDVFIFNIAGSCLFAIAGLWLSGVLPYLLYLKRHRAAIKPR